MSNQSNEWEPYVLTHTIPTYRSGWPGLWDHFISVITGKPQLIIPSSVRFSILVKKNNTDCELLISNPRVEEIGEY